MKGTIGADSRQVWEIIKAPYPVKATRPSGTNTSTSDFYDDNGNATTYVHLSLNQRTVPLHRSYVECEQRDDGWCELSTILQVFDGLLNTARFEYSCFGEYPSTPYGNVTDGVPTTKRSLTSVFGTGLEFGENSDRWRE